MPDLSDPNKMMSPDDIAALLANMSAESAVVADEAAEPIAEPEPEPEPYPTTEDRVAALEAENKTLKAQVSAQSEQMDFYEECIAEMASVVYA